MAHRPLDAELMIEAFEHLGRSIVEPVRIIVGGGAAMVLAYGHPLATQDVDAFAARGGKLSDLDAAAKSVAQTLDVEPDWLNGYFDSYTGVLPGDYSTRLRPVYDDSRLRVDALGPEDLLIMKCFAGRDKDLPHARRLVRLDGVDLDIVDRHLSELCDRGYPRAGLAADYFDDLRDEQGL